jgi:hypothetical protein
VVMDEGVVFEGCCRMKGIKRPEEEEPQPAQ